jgi:hypothetical protein
MMDKLDWLVLARNIHRYLCVSPITGEVLCRHRSGWACVGHRPGAKVEAELTNGARVPIRFERLHASNGERALLPYPASDEAMAVVWAADRKESK